MLVTVEVSRGSFVKRGVKGEIEFVSPLPCPFNYGSVMGSLADDGDPQDALVLGARRARKSQIETQVWAVVRFMDDGLVDDKWICGVAQPTGVELAVVRCFFRTYAWSKWLMSRFQGRLGRTCFLGVVLAPTDGQVG